MVRRSGVIVAMADARSTEATVPNLACGSGRLTGAVNLDHAAELKPGVLHDLNCFPWPFVGDQ